MQNPYEVAIRHGLTITQAIAMLNPRRVSKHNRKPGEGRVRLNKDSSFRKLMRAASRDKLPRYTKLSINLAMKSAGLQ